MPCDDVTYRQRIGQSVERIRDLGVEQIVFGDLYLEDIRRYREEQMRDPGFEPVFPLWQRNTRQAKKWGVLRREEGHPYIRVSMVFFL